MVVYLFLINAVGLLFMYADKQFAKKRLRRISERCLLLTASLGGSAGIYLGMNLFRHKTKHKNFTLGVPLIMIIQAFLLYLFT